MNTQCTPAQLEIHVFGRREVVGRFDGGRLTSDGGGILLREVDRRLGLIDRIAGCFADYRGPRKVEHTATELGGPGTPERAIAILSKRENRSTPALLRPSAGPVTCQNDEIATWPPHSTRSNGLVTDPG